ncbi:armadillo repeat-containing protein 2 isoform X1 [Schistocerca gregaria]|uniref:armadillo repeat-containing protein 2 isoform X1 n=1 Tax=Schistocerca gregaria TaxID=7010 RepID=UPI00211E3632|nr:armadillo repeat-containing protein 2 isoform X1 [Schistocerca gregaria]XP_049839068.1 armadillo repeat-containing protein 2 isoform X1 [Schistocerca gregaria]
MELSTQSPHRIVHGMNGSPKMTVPFYAPPLHCKKTSAEIINEARAAVLKNTGDVLNGAGGSGVSSVRPIDTKRPFTPRERQRTLYGSSPLNSAQRPPSSFSLGYLQFQELEPGSKIPPNARRLNPISLSAIATPANEIEDAVQPHKVPSGEGLKRIKLPSINISRRKQFRNTISLDNLPEELEVEDSSEAESIPERKVRSSPVQRVRPPQDQQSSDSPAVASPLPSKRTLPDDTVKVQATVDTWHDVGTKKPKRSDDEITDKELLTPVTQHLRGKEELEETEFGDSKKETAVSDVNKNKTVNTISGSDINDSSGIPVPTSPIKTDSISVAKCEVEEKVVTSGIPVTKPSTWKPPNYKSARPFSVHSGKKSKAIEDPILDPIYKALKENLPPERNAVSAAVETLILLAKQDDNDAEVISVMSKLYDTLEKGKNTGSSGLSGKQKSQILKALYRYIERPNEMLLLQIARVILALRVTGANLSGVCKLIFKVSRSDKNDKLFLEDNILELFVNALGSASPLEDAEACIYGYGALKFLTMNPALLSRVLNLGALELMVLHIKMINSAKSDSSRLPEQTSHALFQLTGALRNVAGEETMFPQFVSTGAINALCKVMDLFSSDLDVISNASRTLSIISTHDECCDAVIAYDGCFGLFVKLMKKYPGRQDIVVRLGYALGNLMARSDTARTKLYVEEGAISALLELLSLYLEKDLYMDNSTATGTVSSSDIRGSTGSVQDVIVKVIRILANMSINPTVGSKFACVDGSSNEDDTYKDGARFLDMLLSVLERKSAACGEDSELLHSVLSTLNNISYYQTASFGAKERHVACALLEVLSSNNRECLIEAMRVYGNLTRSETSRNILLENTGLLCFLHNLDSDDRELLCATVGVLINMMSDWDKRLALRQLGGIRRLITILSKYGESDWQLATFVCQALWNFCTESSDVHAALGHEETSDLLKILADYLDEERLFGVVEGTETAEAVAESLSYQQWEEFAGVATNLLEKIETYLDSLENSLTDDSNSSSESMAMKQMSDKMWTVSRLKSFHFQNIWKFHPIYVV